MDEEVDQAAIDAAAEELARQKLPFQHIRNTAVRNLAVTLYSLEGFVTFAKDHVVGSANTLFMEQPPGTQYAQCGPGTIRQRRFSTTDEVCEALACELVGKRNVNLDEPHELLARDFTVTCQEAVWKFRSGRYRTQQRAAEAAAKTGKGFLAAAHAAGMAASFIGQAAQTAKDGAATAREAGANGRRFLGRKK